MCFSLGLEFLYRGIFNFVSHRQDGFGKVWNHGLLANIIEEEVTKQGIDLVRSLFP